MIYLDNAATTMHKPEEVGKAVLEAMNSLGNAGRGANTASLGAARTIYGAREKLAAFFHAENPKQIVFTANSTESLNIAIRGILNPGDHVITTVMEHNSVLRPLYEMQEKGVELTILPVSSAGRIVSSTPFSRFMKCRKKEWNLLFCRQMRRAVFLMKRWSRPSGRIPEPLSVPMPPI